MRTLDSGLGPNLLCFTRKRFDIAVGKTLGMLLFDLSSREVVSCN